MLSPDTKTNPEPKPPEPKMTADDTSADDCACELGVLSQCDGSATLCHGDAAVLAAIFGPVEVRPQRELVDRACIEVTFRGHGGVDAVEHRRVEQVVRTTLEQCVFTTLHPRTAICLSLTVLETDPLLLLSTCINAACLALLDAAVSMRFTPAAVTCVPRDDHVDVNPVTDPLHDSSTAPPSSVTVVYDPRSDAVLSVQAAGPLTPSQLSSCVAAGRPAALRTIALYRRALQSQLVREPKEPWAPPPRGEQLPVWVHRPGAAPKTDDEDDAELT